MAVPPSLAPHPRRSSDHLLPTPSGSDPRSRSTQSLVPDGAPYDGPHRRLLLLVYIHGFYGNAQSFRSFPAHVHALLRRLLADSHVVHTKIYPRYKTYRAIDVARDNLSAWLEPHESPNTDVVLVGHSMGGLLAAEVALMPGRHKDALKHRILGTLSLDSPFLGLHPRIVAAGISSLFHPAEDADGEAEPSPAPPETDPCYDPPYWNDEPLKEQPFLSRVMHFTSKHRSDGFFNALRNHIASHLEFGGCLADYPGLVSRYDRLRALEDVDEVRDGSARVRFANYYTLCSGRPKAPKHDAEVDTGCLSDVSENAVEAPYDVDADPADEGDEQHAHAAEEQQPDRKGPSLSQDAEPAAAALVLTTTPPPSSSTKSRESSAAGSGVERDDDADLTPIPDEPTKPEAPDLRQFAEGAARKKAEKDAKRAQRSYEEAIKDRAKAMHRRDKLLEQRCKEAKRKADKQEREAQKQTQRREKEMARAAAAAEKKKKKEEEEKEKKEKEARRRRHEADSEDATTTTTTTTPRGTRKFCALPRKQASCSSSSSYAGDDGDGTWIDVYLEGVDEVGAHCGLFVPSASHYDALVGDVGSRIADWVVESLSTRAVLGGLT